MLDNIDKGILRVLQENSRLSLREIAQQLKDNMNLEVSFSTVGRRIREMEESKVILGYTTVVNPIPFGLKYPMCFFLETDPKADVREIAEELKKIPELLYIHQVAGDFQIASMARCKNAEDAAKVSRKIAQVKGIQKIVSHSVLCTFKEEIKLNFDE